MVSNDVQDELAEGFEPTALPPIAPDGGLELPPMREAPRAPPRLCEQGPCRHYHTFKIQLDAQKPMAVRGDDGTVEQPEAPDHEETHHYCYPDVGIESKLGGLPVIQCNRWSPIPFEERKLDELRVEAWIASEDGKKYTAELEAYHAEQERIAGELAAAASVAADDLATMPAGACELELELRAAVDDALVENEHEHKESFGWETTIEHVRKTALDKFGIDPQLHNSYTAYVVRLNAPPVALTIPSHTISQVGLSSGDRLAFVKTTSTTPQEPHQ